MNPLNVFEFRYSLLRKSTALTHLLFKSSNLFKGGRKCPPDSMRVPDPRQVANCDIEPTK
jgi:hypothetical protein